MFNTHVAAFSDYNVKSFHSKLMHFKIHFNFSVLII